MAEQTATDNGNIELEIIRWNDIFGDAAYGVFLGGRRITGVKGGKGYQTLLKRIIPIRRITDAINEFSKEIHANDISVAKNEVMSQELCNCSIKRHGDSICRKCTKPYYADGRAFGGTGGE